MVQSRLSNFQKRSQWKLPPSVIMKIMMMIIIITSLLDSPLAVDSVSLPLLLEDASSSSSSPSSSVYNHISYNKRKNHFSNSPMKLLNIFHWFIPWQFRDGSRKIVTFWFTSSTKLYLPSPEDSPKPTSSSLKKSPLPIRCGNGRLE